MGVYAYAVRESGREEREIERRDDLITSNTRQKKKHNYSLWYSSTNYRDAYEYHGL